MAEHNDQLAESQIPLNGMWKFQYEGNPLSIL